MQPILYHLHSLSPLHCGTGQAMDVVDLPIARSRATKLPIVPGSSLRGVLRQEITNINDTRADELFGPRNIGEQDIRAGTLSVGDGNLLLLPVRCLAGVVSYVTSPFVLRRYKRDCAIAHLNCPDVPQCAENHALITEQSVNRLDDTLVLEDLDVQASVSEEAREWAEIIAKAIHADNEEQEAQDDLISRFAILPDSVMQYLTETATEIRTRIAIDQQTGTVKDGALWHEEALPAESILWGMCALAPPNGSAQGQTARLRDVLPSPCLLLQLGGNAGVGAGLVRFLLGETS